MVPRSWRTSKHDYRNQSDSPTRYVKMLLDMEKIPILDNILAGGFSWILLAGYLVFPGTFTSLRKSTSFQETASSSEIGKTAYIAVQNVSLLGVAAACCCIGLFGSSWLCYRNRHNYVWLARKVFLPVLINSATGLFNTLINVYTARAGSWSVTATITAAVTGSFAFSSAILFGVYNNWLLARLQSAFDAEMDR
ncbi:hypothetical protein BDV29DRAFT_194051 [Aspergillus leporis]|uniref:Uncharacterized protein n=1 Tax=Aspergillus leporis TaxID=41062 RepID=A0A5N5WTH2_9EURO|nr:hypothetical protein BDV29DRAFT_194051 [Aspergillus leporis]